MERGLWQGDPLSPLLFLIVVEALSLMMVEACRLIVYSGFKHGINQLELSHLQFVDDTLFLGEWSLNYALNLIALLQNFELVSGLKINLQKSCVFCVGVPKLEVDRLVARLHCCANSLPFIYLGLP